MKRTSLYLLLFLLLSARSFGQAAHTFNLNKLSKQDTLVSGWGFHAGDNAEWSKPGIDDRNWKTVDPSIHVEKFTELNDAGVGWLRVHLRMDSSLAGRSLAFNIEQYSATEIYLNGKLLVKYGTVSADPSKVEGYVPSEQPFIVPLVPGKDNVIAVRIAYQRNLPYLSALFQKLSAFALRINDFPSATANYYTYNDRVKNFILLYALFSGMVLIVFFTYIIYYLFDRKNKLYLYYALFCLSICCITLPNEVFGIERFGSLTTEMWSVYVEGTGFVLGMPFLLLTIYTMFNYQKRIIFTVLSAIGIVGIVLMFFNGFTFFFIDTSIIPLLFMLESVHVCIRAMKDRKKDATYVLVGVVSFVMLMGWSSLIDQRNVWTQFLWGVGIVCFPLGMAFYLGIQSSLTNKQLAASVVEIQTLSEQKQQILADQNVLLEQQVNERTAELRQSQNQLIQAEKMASLGELTAGIAHEIQNPLNFVNNFSEVSIELLSELKEEEEKGNKQDVITIADDLSQNLEKIRHHGQRADAIVKGMLQHSRTSSGQKEPTDLNALADEYLRLAYHGLRAKDKSFNAELITNYNADLPKVNAVPQDIGRVLLNIINNAFYATQQKVKSVGTDYKPEIRLTTGIQSGQAVISVKDNGVGIPDNIREKIMQPFFTTKPTGEGTGLGLSLSYDIVVKGHSGKIDVKTKIGEYTEFIVTLPLS